MKTRFLPMFVVVAALALLAGFPQSGGAVPQPQEPEPPVIKMQEEFCPPGEPCQAEAPYAPRRHSPGGSQFMPEGARQMAQAESVAAPLATGGPDDFGYTWDDSVTFNWIDATRGIDSGLSRSTSGASVSGPIDLGFAFKFYQNTYTSLYIVQPALRGCFNQSSLANRTSTGYVPNPGTPNNFIAPYLAPLCELGSYTGRVFYSVAAHLRTGTWSLNGTT